MLSTLQGRKFRLFAKVNYFPPLQQILNAGACTNRDENICNGVIVAIQDIKC